MAGILANSASVVMTVGTPDAINGGYITNEAITLSTLPAGSSYSWGLAKPQGASTRSNLSGTSDAAPVFVPDTHGIWVVTCLVDGTAIYILRIGVEAVAVTTHGDASRYIPIGNATVPAPALGSTLFHSRDLDGLAVKLPNNTVVPIIDGGSGIEVYKQSLSYIHAAGDTGVWPIFRAHVDCELIGAHFWPEFGFAAGLSSEDMYLVMEDGTIGSVLPSETIAILNGNVQTVYPGKDNEWTSVTTGLPGVYQPPLGVYAQIPEGWWVYLQQTTNGGGADMGRVTIELTYRPV